MKWIASKAGFDEVFGRPSAPRLHYAALISILESFTLDDGARRERLQRLALMNQGITFTVYGEKDGLERMFPFDFVPRIIPAGEWKLLQDGLVQRITALNLFLLDIYQEQKCLRDKVIPAELVFSRREYKRELRGVIPPRKIFTHVIEAIDLPVFQEIPARARGWSDAVADDAIVQQQQQQQRGEPA